MTSNSKLAGHEATMTDIVLFAIFGSMHVEIQLGTQCVQTHPLPSELVATLGTFLGDFFF